MNKILIVDDNRTIQLIVSHTLNRAGYATITESSGAQALDRLEIESNNITLAFIDLHMAQMDGLALLQEIRTSQKYALMPVIVITGSGETEKQQAALQLGADALLQKPVSSFDLLDAVARFTEAYIPA